MLIFRLSALWVGASKVQVKFPNLTNYFPGVGWAVGSFRSIYLIVKMLSTPVGNVDIFLDDFSDANTKHFVHKYDLCKGHTCTMPVVLSSKKWLLLLLVLLHAINLVGSVHSGLVVKYKACGLTKVNSCCIAVIHISWKTLIDALSDTYAILAYYRHKLPI